MKTKLLHVSFIKLAPILAQSADLQTGMSNALTVLMLIGFVVGVVCIIGGGLAIKHGDSTAGKMSIVGGIIIAGAPAIMKALYAAFGNSSAAVDMGGFQ